jgi:hypothetical protein
MSIDRQAYMASREWALKREAVRERSGNRCERCVAAPQKAVHHMTYEHLGDEPLDELLAVCNPCHEWLSGKSAFDPAMEIMGSVFLAGGGLQKAGDWRTGNTMFVPDSRFHYGGPWDNTSYGLRDADCLFGYVVTAAELSRASVNLGTFRALRDPDHEPVGAHAELYVGGVISNELGTPTFGDYWGRADSLEAAWAGFVENRWERLSWERFVPDARFNIYGECKK